MFFRYERDFWELRGWQLYAFLGTIGLVSVYAFWMGVFSDGGGVGCRILREVWRDEGVVPEEIETYEEDPRDRQRFRVTCRPADANVAPDCAVMWTVEGRVRQRRCGPIDQSSIEDWL